MAAASRDDTTLDADDNGCHRGHVFGILITALVVVELSKDILFSAAHRDWLPALLWVCQGMIACLPFLLAKLAPKAAGFDIQWFPASRRHWGWFLGMAVVLIVSKGLIAALVVTILGQPPSTPFIGPVTPTGIVFWAVAILVVGPVTEEIFFRGFVLEQLRKLTSSGVALLVQSVLFGLSHLYARGLFTAPALVESVWACWVGLILGLWRIRFRSLLPLVLAHALINAGAIVPLKARYDQAIARANQKFPAISAETTFITGPLRSDGYPDYAAALNQRCSRGVTPETNSAVLFWNAMGPREILDSHREEYFRMLGVGPPPKTGDYFINLDEFLVQRKSSPKPAAAAKETETWYDAYALLEPALRKPWSAEDFPVLAQWLAANEKPLAMIVEASRRPRRYDPLVCGEKGRLVAVLQPVISLFHQPGNVADALVARALLCVGESRVDEAWEDLLACHRLARLLGQGPMALDASVARSVEESVCAAERALVEHSRLTASRIAAMREDLARLPPMCDVANAFEHGERFTYLDIVVNSCFRDWPVSISGLERAAAYWEKDGFPDLAGELRELDTAIKPLLRDIGDGAVDWDIVLRMGNSWYDRIVDAYRKPTRSQQREAFNRLDEELRRLKASMRSTTSLHARRTGDRTETHSERVGQVLLAMFSPTITAHAELDSRAKMMFELTRLAFALEAYRADHGSYPARLTDLAPAYVRKVPKDLFNNAEPRYCQEGNGYVLYSVGSNEKDDGGRGFQNGSRQAGTWEKDWDDLVVRVAVPE